MTTIPPLEWAVHRERSCIAECPYLGTAFAWERVDGWQWEFAERVGGDLPDFAAAVAAVEAARLEIFTAIATMMGEAKP